MHGAGGGFRAEQISRPDLYAGCAERHSRRHAFRIRDAARSNDWEFHRLRNLRHQRQRANLGTQVVRQKHAAMAARLKALRNDSINSMRCQPTRLFDGGGRREDLRAPGFHSRQQFGRGQTKMKAHHRRLEFAQHVRGFGIEGARPGPTEMVSGSIPNSW